MPITTSLTPSLPALRMMVSIIGISESPPSSEKRFWPTYLVCSVQLVVAAGRFQLLVDPLALLDLGDVHELRTDRAGVGRLQARQQVAQLHARLATDAAGAEFAAEVAIGQAGARQAQVRGVDRRGQAQWVQAGVQMAARAVGAHPWPRPQCGR
ncbi:hypothetical protein G6F68_016127 [Rhizopus microsporus]|nr:hypothetical protein G6F68_016127 [Rhizopus microsporus]